MKKDDIKNLLEHSLGGTDDEKYHLTEAEHLNATSQPTAAEPGLMPAGVLRGIQMQPVPKSSTSPGMTGMQAVDAYYYYYYFGTEWRRKALSTWVEASSSSSSSSSSSQSSSSSSLIFSHSSESSSSESSN